MSLLRAFSNIASLLERVLAPTERPADLVRRRLEQAGYDVADGLQTLGSDEIGFLIKFIYKSNLLGGAGVSGSHFRVLIY